MDSGVGAVKAAGMGEAVVKTCGIFLVVNLMRQGYGPDYSSKEAFYRIAKNTKLQRFLNRFSGTR